MKIIKKPTRQLLAVLCMLLWTMTGCYKYKEAPDMSNPAYLRVFNSIPYNVDVLHAGQASPFLCMLVDPRFDKAGVPSGGVIEGDFLHTRQLFSLSYPIDAATSLNAGNGNAGSGANAGQPAIVTNANYEYPGKMHVLPAPSINGLDLSAWAQVPSGKHRFLFVTRPENNTLFDQLPATLRKNVLIDTTVDLQAGEVYTMHALATDLDNAGYGAYVRKEPFVHQQLDAGRSYVSFYNLSGVRPYLATDPRYPHYYYYSDTMSVAYTYYIFDDNYGTTIPPAVRPLPQSDNVYLTTFMRKDASQSAPLYPVPFLPRSYFFDDKGIVRTFQDDPLGTISGTLPYLSFAFTRANEASVVNRFPYLNCSGNPATFNNLDPDLVNNSDTYTNSGGTPPYAYLPNVNLVIASGGSIHIYPTVNVLEVLYNRIYMMQVQRRFEIVPGN